MSSAYHGYEGVIAYDAANSRFNWASVVSSAQGYRIDGFVESVALRYHAGDLSAIRVYSTIEEWEARMDGALGQLAGAAVTLDAGDSFFVESEDRSTGIRVGKIDDEPYYPGSYATVNGMITTNANGERMIVPSYVITEPGGPFIGQKQ